MVSHLAAPVALTVIVETLIALVWAAVGSRRIGFDAIVPVVLVNLVTVPALWLVCQAFPAGLHAGGWIAAEVAVFGVETVLLAVTLRGSWSDALWIAGVLNAASALIGLVVPF